MSSSCTDFVELQTCEVVFEIVALLLSILIEVAFRGKSVILNDELTILVRNQFVAGGHHNRSVFRDKRILTFKLALASKCSFIVTIDSC